MSGTPFLAETAGFEPACPKGANAFRVRLVMTTSIRLHVLVAVRVFATCVARRGIYGIVPYSRLLYAYSQLALLIAGFTG